MTNARAMKKSLIPIQIHEFRKSRAVTEFLEFLILFTRIIKIVLGQQNLPILPQKVVIDHCFETSFSY